MQADPRARFFELFVDRLPVAFFVFEVDRRLIEVGLQLAARQAEGVGGGGPLAGEFGALFGGGFFAPAFVIAAANAQGQGASRRASSTAVRPNTAANRLGANCKREFL
jgi:hypothetical protein